MPPFVTAKHSCSDLHTHTRRRRALAVEVLGPGRRPPCYTHQQLCWRRAHHLQRGRHHAGCCAHARGRRGYRRALPAISPRPSSLGRPPAAPARGRRRGRRATATMRAAGPSPRLLQRARRRTRQRARSASRRRARPHPAGQEEAPNRCGVGWWGRESANAARRRAAAAAAQQRRFLSCGLRCVRANSNTQMHT